MNYPVRGVLFSSMKNRYRKKHTGIGYFKDLKFRV
jgi:hypothetical protein